MPDLKDGNSIPFENEPEAHNVPPKGPIHIAANRAEASLFRLALSTTDGKEVGWLGLDEGHLWGYWAKVVTNPSDAVSLHPYTYTDGKTYYRLGPDESNNAGWMFADKTNRVGFWSWGNATPWRMDGRLFRSEGPGGGQLSLDSNDRSMLMSQGILLNVEEVSPYAGAIRHIFVLLMENRSFDHMLGFSGITGKDAETGKVRSINGLTGSEFNEFGGKKYPVTKGIDWSMPADPGHEFNNILTQLCGGTGGYRPGAPYPAENNSGFVADYAAVKGVTNPAEVMKCCDPNQVPAITTLAKEFVVCDNWFASLPGPTWPNRYFSFAASSGGLDDSPTEKQLKSWSSNPWGGFKFANNTLFGKNALQWDIYVDQIYGSNCASVAGISHLYLRFFSDFASKLNGGDAGQFIYIEPDYGHFWSDYKNGNSQHPLDDVRNGDRFIADVYSAIRNSPLWEHSMLIITYDEHGGFYDHVAPPAALPPGDKQIMPDVNTHGFTFNQYGVRVPALVVSPLVEKGIIDGRLYEHSSIPATVEAMFKLAPLTERDKAVLSAGRTLDKLITLTAPRQDCPKSLPKISAAELDGAFPEAREFVMTMAQKEIKREQPIDSMGNLPGFVYSVMRLHIEISPPEDEPLIVARVQSLKTVGDAEDYIDEVKQLAAVRAINASPVRK